MQYHILKASKVIIKGNCLTCTKLDLPTAMSLSNSSLFFLEQSLIIINYCLLKRQTKPKGTFHLHLFSKRSKCSVYWPFGRRGLGCTEGQASGVGGGVEGELWLERKTKFKKNLKCLKSSLKLWIQVGRRLWRGEGVPWEIGRQER